MFNICKDKIRVKGHQICCHINSTFTVHVLDGFKLYMPDINQYRQK